MRELNRIQPVGPASAYKTWEIKTPKSHTRPATCRETDCPNYLNGWKTILSVSQVDLIQAVRKCGKSYQESFDGTTYTFTFEAGQSCFAERKHTIQVRPEIYIVRGGDHRGNPLGTPARIHTRPSDWVEDFAENVERLSEERKRG